MQRSKNYDAAEAAYKRAMSLIEMSSGRDPRLPGLLNAYAELFKKTHRKERSHEYSERARALRDERPESQTVDVSAFRPQ